MCTLTLIALAAMAPVLGADVVVGGQRKQIFTDTIKRDVRFFLFLMHRHMKIDFSMIECCISKNRENCFLNQFSRAYTNTYSKTARI